MDGDDSSLDGDLEEFLTSQGIYLQPSNQRATSSASASAGREAAGNLNLEDSGVFDPEKDEVMNGLGSAAQLTSLMQSEGIDVLKLQLSDLDVKNKTLSLYVFDAWAGSVLSGCHELIERLNNTKSSVQNISINSHQNEADIKALNRYIDTLEAKLADENKQKNKLQIRTQELEAKLGELIDKKKNDDAETKRTVRGLEQVTQELERRNRMKDAELAKYRQKLQELANKDKEMSEKNRSTLTALRSEIQKGGASLNESFSTTSTISQSQTTPVKVASSKGGKSVAKPVTVAEIVSALESEKRVLVQKVVDLEQQNQELSQAFRENRSPDSSRSIDSSDQDIEVVRDSAKSDTAKEMFDKLLEQERLISEQNMLIEELKKEVEVGTDRISEMSLSFKNLQDAMDNLNEELKTRPSAREYTKLRQELEEAQGKVRDLVMMRGEMAEINAWRSQLSTAERIKIDKRNHELGLWMIDSLPKSVMKDILQSICRELDLSDVSEILGSIEKLKFVVKSVPRMERFISQISNFVLSKEAERKPGQESSNKLEDVGNILKKWWANLRKMEIFAEFHDCVLQELSRRDKALSDELHDFNDLAGYWSGADQSKWRSVHPSRVQNIVRDLVDFQLDIFKRERTVRAVDEFIKDRPDVVLNKIVSHVQYLFGINSIEGIIPKLNQVYLFSEEMKVFFTLCREELEMDNGVPDKILQAEIHRRLELYKKK